MGSWRLYFVTLTEQRAFLAALLETYRKRCKVGAVAAAVRVRLVDDVDDLGFRSPQHCSYMAPI